MTTTPPKPRRLRRPLIGAGVIVLTLFLGIPTVFVLRTRFQISSALRSASAVRLEEYSSGKVLSRHPLTPTEFQRVTDAVPITADFGIPGVIAMCFVPHHRVIITDRATQLSTTFDVCFSCEQMQLAGSDILPTPSAWRQPLRRLFLRHDIPIRDRYPLDSNAESQ